MAHDLSHCPNSGVQVQACGDCHLSNFGVYATPERQITFDINDFDETIPAPFEWDLKRLATSFFVASSEKGFPQKKCSEIVQRMLSHYRKGIRELSDMSILDRWYARADDQRILALAPDLPVKKGGKRPKEEPVSSTLGQINPLTSGDTQGRRRIIDNNHLLYHPPEKWHLEEQFARSLQEYRKSLPAERQILYDRYRLDDICIKVVGVGSVGTRCLIMLYGAEEGDELILQVKEARHSVLEPFVGAGAYGHQGERVVIGQRIMQATSDIFLGWMTDKKDGIQYYVRQLGDMKYSANVEKMSHDDLLQYAGLCGWTLARAHVKGGDCAVIDGYLGKGDDFDSAIGEFAIEYAEQVSKDYKEFIDALKSGKLNTKTKNYAEAASA
jgi:uncharacterized protein (DUF2252 family)